MYNQISSQERTRIQQLIQKGQLIKVKVTLKNGVSQINKVFLFPTHCKLLESLQQIKVNFDINQTKSAYLTLSDKRIVKMGQYQNIGKLYHQYADKKTNKLHLYLQQTQPF